MSTPAPDGKAGGESSVPPWLVRLGAIGWRSLVVLALAIVLIWIAWLLGTVTASIALALILSAAFAPLVIRLRGEGWSRARAAAVATVAAVAILGLVLAVVAALLVHYGPQLIRTISDGLDTLGQRLGGMTVSPEVTDTLRRLADSLQGWVASAISDLVGSAASLFTVLLFGVFTTFFLLLDGDHAWAWAMQSASERRREAATASGLRGLGRVGGYLRTVALLAAVEAVVDFILMTIFGVPLALPLATLVFVGGFVPYIGGVVTTSAIVLAALASIGTEPTIVLLVLIIVAVILEGRFFDRMDMVHLHPAIILIVLPIGAVTGGLFGLIVAVPIAAFVQATAGSLLDAVRPDPSGQTDAGTTVVPDWLDVLAQWSWRLLVGIALLAVGIFAIVQVPIVLMPIVLAAVLASTLAPLMGALQRRGWATSLAAAVVTLGAYAGISAIILLTVGALFSNADQVVDSSSGGSSSISDSLQGLAGSLQALVEEVGAGLLGAIASILAGIVGLVFVVVLAVILTFYFLRDGRAAWTALTARLAPWRRREVDAAGGRAVTVLGGYMIGTGAISAFGAATQLVIMVILGIPLALPLAVLSFFGGFIPYIGSFVTTGLAFLVTVAYGSPTDIAVMGIFTIVFNIVQGNIVAPLVYGRAVNIHPAIVLLAIPAGSAVAGVTGMFLVVPFLGVVATTWRAVLAVMGDRPAGDEPAAATGDAPGVTAAGQVLATEAADG